LKGREKKRLKVFVTGIVQGVGFRPFVYRLAVSLNLKGWVANTTYGVVIEVEGEEEKLVEFLKLLDKKKPQISKIFSLEYKFLPPVGYETFEIRKSKEEGKVKVSVLPDISTCEDCLKELFDPNDRRYLYPFINCTNCGPRFTIIEKLPYDRKNTSMKVFEMCKYCKKEYEDPTNRRFHAQPNACWKCGPNVSFWNSDKKKVAEGIDAIELVVDYIKKGKIVAVKGIGGFHILCDASNSKAVRILRERKKREEKPFAVMFKSVEEVEKHAHLSEKERLAIEGPESPIVILKKKKESNISEEVAPRNSTVGAFLPYSPIHHLILSKLENPVVATSCNITDEPIVKDNETAISLIGNLVDGVLTHNRDIVRRCDDSVVRVMGGVRVPIRRSRGFVPVPVLLKFNLKRQVLALGGHMRNTVAVAKDNKVYLSQHIGDIDNVYAEEFFKEVVKDMLSLFEVEPEVVVCDRHPGYFSTKFGEEMFGNKLVKVYHHHAHIISCMAENEVEVGEKVIGLSYDGTGYGEDGTIWGGEVIVADYTEFERKFHLLRYPLLGGEWAVKEPYRSAYALLKVAEFKPEEILRVDEKKLAFLEFMMKKGNYPETSSLGRLFDGISAILGICYVATYQAQGAILLEQIAEESDVQTAYPFEIAGGEIDWRPVVRGVVEDLKKSEDLSVIARKFHNTVILFSVRCAEILREETGINTVALSGGVFQNKLIFEGVSSKLKEKNFRVLVHQIVPPNDGGISLGQAVYGGLI